MRSYVSRLSVALVLAAAWQASARAELTVTVSEMHLCCPACTKAVEKAIADLKGVEGVKCTTNQDEGTTVLACPDAKAAQKALDAVAAAGFVGKLDTEEVKFAEIKTPEGKVKRLEVYEVHNCCGACTKAIKGALAEVEGVVADTCKAKETSFAIEGDFSAKDAVAAMAKAGFYCSLEKPKEKPAP
jgi:mercuric ion binding protein